MHSRHVGKLRRMQVHMCHLCQGVSLQCVGFCFRLALNEAVAMMVKKSGYTYSANEHSVYSAVRHRRTVMLEACLCI